MRRLRNGRILCCPSLPKAEPALRELAARYAAYLGDVETSGDAGTSGDAETALADICHTAGSGRSHFKYRLALPGATMADMRTQLAQFAAAQDAPDVVRGAYLRPERPRIAFLYTGHGSQYVHMGRGLYETEPVFRAAVQECEELLRPYLDIPMTAVLYPEAEREAETAQLWAGMTYTQPAQFVLAYALTKLWASWGITPDAVTGHSVGEYAAACAAGMISVADGIKLVAARGRLMDGVPQKGEMAAVFADEQTVATAVAPYADRVSLAVINGPTNIVISGLEETVEAIRAELKAAKVKTRRLDVAQSSHSPLVESFLDEFEAIAQTVTYAPSQVTYISGVTGAAASFAEVGRAAYWRTHQRQPVRFADAATTLLHDGYDLLLEIGPAPTLLGIIQRLPLADEVTFQAVPSLRKDRDDNKQILSSLGALYVGGVDVPWAQLGQPRQRVHLPTYPFQRQRYWLEAAPQMTGRQTSPLHPLLGWRVRAATQDVIFEQELSLAQLPFLAAHRVFGTAVFPAAGYLEMALAAGTAVRGQLPALQDVLLHAPLRLPEDASVPVQLLLAADGAFQVLSQGSDERWTLHAAGQLAASSAMAAATSLAEAQAQCREERPLAAQYDALHARGLDYGAAFRGMTRLWHGEGAALAQVHLPAEVNAAGYHWHPALLDACLHPLSALLDADEGAYLPFSAAAVQVYGRFPAQVWSYAVWHAQGAETVTGDVFVYDADGALLATVLGFALKRVTETAVVGANYDDWLYEVAWRETETAVSVADVPPAHYLIFADAGAHEAADGVATQLAAQLTERGHRCTFVFPGETFAGANGQYHLNPTRPEAFARLLSETGAPDAVLYLWALDTAVTAAATPAAAQERVVGAALSLVQALAAARMSPRLWLVTQGAQPVGPIPAAVAQLPLWGLGKVIAQEYPELACTRLDLDPAGTDVTTAVAEILAAGMEDQVALRGQGRFVPRLVRVPQEAEPPLAGRPFQLTTSQPGVLENLAIRPLTRRQPQAGEVEIEVMAAGLGFRDVLNALGMYPGGPIPFGGECAGVVTAVGADVTQVQVGDAVLAMAIGSFQSYAYCPADFVTPKPAHLSFVEAATIPSAFLTAYYALVRLAKLQSGERVLIHAAAGGVGMAAVQIARHLGAEVWGTAGSAQKRTLLRALGVQHVFDSRSTAFAAEILAQADGVDVILNSLSGEFVAKSVAVLVPNGRFVEIGKRDIWTAAQFAAVRPQADYHVIDLAAIGQDDPALIQGMLREVMALFNQGVLRPLPTHTFAMGTAVDAFRFMAQARHTGKIVLKKEKGSEKSENHSSLISPHVSYLVTGGLGGLGLAVARWLAEMGARHLALVGRSAPAAAAQAVLAELAEAGVQVTVLAADVSRQDDMARVLAQMAAEMPPLRGVIHAAGVLDDGVLAQQSWERFARVFAPKVGGGWILHELTKQMPLDFFVLFSSAVALLGSAGQANHVAASTFLDGLAHYRRALGLPVLSIDWGPWSEVGAAAKEGIGERVQQRGIRSMTPAQGIAALAQVMARRDDLTQVGIVDVDWAAFRGQADAPFFTEMAQLVAQEAATAVAAAPSSAWQQRIQDAPPSKRPNLLLAFVQEQALKVLGLAADFALNPQQPLQELGLDS
ncbi:MAG: type I polyketide synthase, partial [Chloroflexota bacterium]